MSAAWTLSTTIKEMENGDIVSEANKETELTAIGFA